MATWRAQPSLRQKIHVDPRKTDVQIFNSLALGDTWDDACLLEAYRYLRSHAMLVIPPTWEDAFKCFDGELSALDRP